MDFIPWPVRIVSVEEIKRMFPMPLAWQGRARNKPVSCTSHARRIYWKKNQLRGIDPLDPSPWDASIT